MGKTSAELLVFLVLVTSGHGSPHPRECIAPKGQAAAYQGPHYIEAFHYHTLGHLYCGGSKCYPGFGRTSFAEPTTCSSYPTARDNGTLEVWSVRAKEQAVGPLLRWLRRPLGRGGNGGSRLLRGVRGMFPSRHIGKAGRSRETSAGSPRGRQGRHERAVPKPPPTHTRTTVPVPKSQALPKPPAAIAVAMPKAAAETAASQPADSKLLEALIQHARTVKDMPQNLQALLDQHVQDDARQQRKRLHTLVNLQDISGDFETRRWPSSLDESSIWCN